MLTPKMYAEKIGKPYQTVMFWLRSGKIPQAVKTITLTGHLWEIPENTPAPEVQRGRPKPQVEAQPAKKANVK